MKTKSLKVFSLLTYYKLVNNKVDSTQNYIESKIRDIIY